MNYHKIRDTTLFLSGIILIFYEAIIRSGPERPYLLILYAGMIGLPTFLRVDEKKKEPKEGNGL